MPEKVLLSCQLKLFSKGIICVVNTKLHVNQVSHRNRHTILIQLPVNETSAAYYILP
jgi:hypothetical protein